MPDHEALVTYEYRGVKVTILGARGGTSRISMKVSHGGSSGEVTASATGPDWKTQPTAGATPEQIYSDEVAAGMPAREAMRSAGYSMGRAAIRGHFTPRLTRIGVPRDYVGEQLPPVCAHTTASTGNSATVCDVQKIIQMNGANWYVGDQITTTGNYNSTLEGLTGLWGRDNYGAHNQITTWRPASVINISGCGYKNSLFSLTEDGVVIDVPNQLVCPDTLQPTTSNVTTGQGDHWAGCSGASQAAPEVDEDYSPSDATIAVNVDVTMAWNVCFT